MVPLASSKYFGAIAALSTLVTVPALSARGAVVVKFTQRGLPWQPLDVPGVSQHSVPVHLLVAGTEQQYQPAAFVPYG